MDRGRFRLLARSNAREHRGIGEAGRGNVYAGKITLTWA